MFNTNECKYIQNAMRSCGIKEVIKPSPGMMVSTDDIKTHYLTRQSGKESNAAITSYSGNGNEWMALDNDDVLHSFDYDENRNMPIEMQACLNVMTKLAKKKMTGLLLDNVKPEHIEGLMLSSNCSLSNIIGYMSVFNERAMEPRMESWFHDMNNGFYINPVVYCRANTLLTNALGENWIQLMPVDIRDHINSNVKTTGLKFGTSFVNNMTELLNKTDMDVRWNVIENIINQPSDSYGAKLGFILGGAYGSEIQKLFSDNVNTAIEFMQYSFRNAWDVKSFNRDNVKLVIENYKRYIDCLNDNDNMSSYASRSNYDWNHAHVRVIMAMFDHIPYDSEFEQYYYGSLSSRCSPLSDYAADTAIRLLEACDNLDETDYHGFAKMILMNVAGQANRFGNMDLNPFESIMETIGRALDANHSPENIIRLISQAMTTDGIGNKHYTGYSYYDFLSYWMRDEFIEYPLEFVIEQFKIDNPVKTEYNRY